MREDVTCNGSNDCPAEKHIHGCFADDAGACDAPEEHTPMRENVTIKWCPQCGPQKTDSIRCPNCGGRLS